MTQIFLMLFLGGLPLVITACGRDCDESKSHSAITQANPAPQKVVVEERVTINGEAPENYYRHFRYQNTLSCKNLWYRFAGTFPFGLAKDEAGREMLGEFSIMLLEDGTYFAIYKESVVVERSSKTTYSSADLGRLRLKGRWKIDGAGIVLENLGRGHAMIVNDQRTIQLRIERDILRAGLTGRTIEVLSFNANHMPIPELDNCARK